MRTENCCEPHPTAKIESFLARNLFHLSRFKALPVIFAEHARYLWGGANLSDCVPPPHHPSSFRRQGFCRIAGITVGRISA